MFVLFLAVVCLQGLVVHQAIPIPQHLLDMTYVFDNNTLHWPTQKKFEIVVKMNGTYNNSYWLQLEEYNSAIHVGTHMDAPCHFAEGRWTVDQIPLERLIAPAAVVDITDKAEADRDYQVTIEDITKWESETGYTVDETVLMIRSGWGRRWGDREAFTGTAEYDDQKLHFPGLSAEAAQWLVDNRKIYGVGTEALSLDPGTSRDFRAHRILLGANIYGLENVANVTELPVYGATLHILPMKIGSASGAPVRIIASYPEVIMGQRSGHSVTERSLREVIIFS